MCSPTIPALLDEIKGLVEWPVPLMGSIDEEFMALPAEALVGTMRANQKYLTMRTADGALAPRFVVVANMAASDGGAAIVAGNERVLRARLWDARFFWDQDRKASLESRLPAHGADGLPCRAGHPGAARRAAGGPGRCARALCAERRPSHVRAGSAVGQGRSGHRHGRRVPRAAGHHGRPLRPGAGRAGGGGGGDPRPLRTQRPRRYLPDARPTASWSPWPTSSTR